METKRSDKLLEHGGELDAATPPTPRQADLPNRPQMLPSADRDGLLTVLERIEQSLAATRNILENVARERQHREFSPARLVGALLQALVVGFVIAALSDWVYGAKEGPQLVKLAYAAVLQLGALTAFVISRERG